MPKNLVIKFKKKKYLLETAFFFSDRDLLDMTDTCDIYKTERGRTHKAFIVLMSSFLFCDFWEGTRYSTIDSITKMFVSFSSLLVLVVLELLRRANIAGASSIRSSSRIYDVSIDG